MLASPLHHHHHCIIITIASSLPLHHHYHCVIVRNRFLISACYSKAKLAAACAGIIYFITYVPYMYVAIREEAAGDRIPAWLKSLAVSKRPSNPIGQSVNIFTLLVASISLYRTYSSNSRTIIPLLIFSTLYPSPYLLSP